MKKFLVCAVLLAGLMKGSHGAATIFLANAADGSGSLSLGGGESGTINIMLTTAVSDVTPVAFLTLYFDLDSTVCDTDVTNVVQGQTDPQWTYDISSYTLPAELDDSCDGYDDGINEYGLKLGSEDGPGFPLGTATHLIDSLIVTHDGVDTHDDALYFEGNPRLPSALGPPPTYTPFTLNDFICTPIPTLLNMGVGNYTPGCKDGFDIHNTPEPAGLGLVAVGGLAVFRRLRSTR